MMGLRKVVYIVVTLTVSLGMLLPQVLFASSAPRVVLSDEKHVFGGDPVRIRAVATDPDGDSLAFYWEQTIGDSLKLRGVNTDTLAFTAPDVGSEKSYRFTLTVSDGSQNTEEEVTVYVDEKDETVPEADAGKDKVATPGETVFLSGSAIDEDSLALTFSWVQVSGPSVNFVRNLAKTNFIAPSVESDTTLSFELTVDDGENTSKDLVSVLVKAPPVVVVETPLPTLSPAPAMPAASTLPVLPDLLFIDAPDTAKAGELVRLRASVDLPTATYFWRIANPSLTVSDLYSRETTLVVPSTFTVGQGVVVELSVYDGDRVLKKQHEIIVIAGRSAVVVDDTPLASELAVGSTARVTPELHESTTAQIPNRIEVVDDVSNVSQETFVTQDVQSSVYAASVAGNTSGMDPKFIITAILVLAGLLCIAYATFFQRKPSVVASTNPEHSSSHIYLYDQRK